MSPKFGETKIVEYDDFEVTVSTATAGMAMERDVAIDESDDWLKERGYTREQVFNDQVDHRTKRIHFLLIAIRPQCLGALKEWRRDGQALTIPTIDQFLGLPEPLIHSWYAAAIGLNPHWLPPVERPEEEKKRTETRRGSSRKS